MRLITRPDVAGPSLVESVPPSGAKLFAALQITPAIACAGFIRSSGNTVWWGRDQARVETFGEGRVGWQVDANRLQQVLLAEAAAAGAHVVRETVASDVTGIRNGARFCLDCTGRRGLFARALKQRRYEPTLRSVALVGDWTRIDAWSLPDESHTLIESYEDGWAWSVPSGAGQRQVAVMVDPRTSDLEGGNGTHAYLAEISKTHRLRALLRNGTLVAPPRGWDASMYFASRYVSDNVLLVGDAGSFVDPLSSAGVRKALVSAWVAAIVVHTCLLRPERRTLALAYFEARETRMYESLRRLTREHLAAASAGHAEAFWQDRAPSIDIDEPAVTMDGAAGRERVRAAYQEMRRAPTLRLRLAPRARIVTSGAIEGCEIVAKRALLAEDADGPVLYIGEVDVVTLCDIAGGATDAGVMFDEYCRRAGPVDLPRFLEALATAIACGWLVEENGRVSRR